MIYRKSLLKIHKTREGSDPYNNFGKFYIIDEYRNLLVADHLDTLEEAREEKKRLSSLPEYTGTLPTNL